MARRRKKRIRLTTAALIEVLSLATLVAVVQPTWTTNVLNDLATTASRYARLGEIRLPVATSADSAAVDILAIPNPDGTANSPRISGWSDFPTHTARLQDTVSTSNRWKPVVQTETDAWPAVPSY